MKTELWAIITVILGTFLTAPAPILIKKGLQKISTLSFKIVIQRYFIIAAFLYITGIFIFVTALTGGEVSILFPLASLTYVWATLLSYKFLGEKISIQKWLGIGIVIFGAALIGIGATSPLT